MAQLLFEIGVEELPALSIEPALESMSFLMSEALNKEQLKFSTIQVAGTPRRLVLMIDDLATQQPDINEEIVGPSTTIAYEADGSLSKAALGFIKAKNLDLSSIYNKKTEKGEVIASKLTKIGHATKDLLPAILVNLMRNISFKKRMRWDNSGESFARPVRRLLCLFDNNYLTIKFGDLVSGEVSAGHRFMAPEEFKVTSIEHYKQELAKRWVMLDPKERGRVFIEKAQEKLKNINAQFNNDAELMLTARNIFEYPFVVVGSFEKEYLAIPKEILISEMKAHQKCFAVLDSQKNLLNYFVCTAATKPFDEEFFAKGNARVLRARFEDGAYYFAEDKKKSLKEHALLLKNLIFEGELGTYAQKSERIEKIGILLAENLKLESEINLIKKAAPLLKADLVSGVVGQFPDLQGVMGRIYASIDGEESEVGEIIESHYWPRFADDKLPRLKAAALLSIADKLDTLVGIIALDKKPKGNKDPFGLRRAAIGLVRLLVNCNFDINLEDLVSLAVLSYGKLFKAQEAKLLPEIVDFIVQRARGLLIEDLGASFADGILAVGYHNLLDAFARASVLSKLRNENPAEFESLSQAFKRAGNIVKKAQSSGDILKSPLESEEILHEPSEKMLLKAVRETKHIIAKQSNAQDLKARYAELFAHVALLKPSLDAFFDSVMVMVDDKQLRAARLGLLGEIKQVADKIADFTHL